MSLGATCDYIFSHGDPLIVGSSMAGENAKEIRREFAAVVRQRPDIKKPAEHIPLSLPMDETLTPLQWEEFVSLFLKKLGIDPERTQWILVKHSDKKHEHAHLLINRVQIDGKVWDYHNDVNKTIKATHELELELPYLQDTSGCDGKNKGFHPTRNEQYRSGNGKEITREIIFTHIKSVLHKASINSVRLTPEKFIDALRISSGFNIEVKAKMSDKGEMLGFSFKMFDFKIAGKGVGAKWSELKNVLDYDEDRDREYLASMSGENKIEISSLTEEEIPMQVNMDRSNCKLSRSDEIDGDYDVEH